MHTTDLARIFIRVPIALVLTFPLALTAQEPTTSPRVLEEIVVTATKRAESIQDVPIAVAAYDSETLRRAGVHDIRQLQILSPSLVVSSSQAETAGTVARIRGVGTTGDNLGLESSVAVFVDGVYRNRNNVALTDLGNVERIEVLRGPQGTLFGKNASAGLIHIITEEPDLEEFNGYAEASIGDQGQSRLAAGLNTPFAQDRLGFRIDGVWRQRDGFIDDLNTGDDYNDRDRWLLRAQLASQIGDNLHMRLIADVSNREETCCAAVTDIVGPTAAIINAITPPGPTDPGVVVPADPFARKFTSNPQRGYTQDVDDWGVSLEINWDAGIGTLTSISSYREWESDRSQDIDYTNADILYRAPGTYSNDFETFTQELRLAGESGPFEWMVGLYYVDETLLFNDAIRIGSDYLTYANTLIAINGETPLPPILIDGMGVQSDAWTQDTESWALFTQNTWNATDRLHFTLGLRYTEEDKEMSAFLTAVNPACLAIAGGLIAPTPTVLTFACLPLINPLVDNSFRFGDPTVPYLDDRSDEEATGLLSAAYDFNDNWMGYVSYSTGFKAGGYNLDRGGLDNPLLGLVPDATDLEFKPETVDSVEVGAKGSMAADRVRLNFAAWYSEFDDYQLNTFTGTNFVVTNLEEATTKGVEFDGQALVTDNLSFQVGAAYTDARYGDNISNPTLAGRRLTNAPFWIVTASGTYERNISSSLMGFIRLDYRFNDDMNTGSDLDVEKIQHAYSIWNGKIGIGAQDNRWVLELWARNMFDQDYRQVVFDAPLQGSGTGPGSTQTFNAFLGDPSLWGATVRVNF